MELKWSTRANADRDKIFEYLAVDSPSAALRIDLQIEAECDLLKHYPHAGRYGRVPHTRELMISHTPYLVIYCLEMRVVVILRVIHGAMKWPA